jgi:hypothetical protein
MWDKLLCDFIHYNVQYVMFIVTYIILKIYNLTLVNYDTSSKDINFHFKKNKNHKGYIFIFKN